MQAAIVRDPGQPRRSRGCEAAWAPRSTLGSHARTREAVPRLALTPEEVAAAIGVSVDFYNEHVRPELRLVRRGRKVLVATRELEAWLDRSAARVLEEGR